MPPGEVRRYLAELARMMRPGAKAFFSVFLSPTGVTETRDSGVNVFHSLAALLADIGALPFDARLTGLQFVTGSRADPDPEPIQSFGYKHNWYALTRR